MSRKLASLGSLDDLNPDGLTVRRLMSSPTSTCREMAASRRNGVTSISRRLIATSPAAAEYSITSLGRTLQVPLEAV